MPQTAPSDVVYRQLLRDRHRELPRRPREDTRAVRTLTLRTKSLPGPTASHSTTAA